MARMDPWKRTRLLACIALMLGMLAVGVYARVRWAVWDAPFLSAWNVYPGSNPFDRMREDVLRAKRAKGRYVKYTFTRTVKPKLSVPLIPPDDREGQKP